MKNLEFVDPTHVFLSRERFEIVKNGVFLYSDYHHVNKSGADLLYDKALRRLLPGEPFSERGEVPDISSE